MIGLMVKTLILGLCESLHLFWVEKLLFCFVSDGISWLYLWSDRRLEEKDAVPMIAGSLVTSKTVSHSPSPTDSSHKDEMDEEKWLQFLEKEYGHADVPGEVDGQNGAEDQP